ncbi:MAG: minor capsid protein [Clostridium sp.]|uniref:minor capsid protein n=1 Tax=Clostridium sp. TaxID=1506 RepID=UPI003F2D9247
MKKRSKSYWENRANERMDGYHKNTNETIYKINKAYDRAIANINSDIRRIFSRYFLSYGLSKTEARDLLNSFISKKELKNIRDQIKIIKDEDLRKYLMAQLNYSPYKARITRLEAMKESIYINTKILAQEEFRQSTSDYVNNINIAYYQSIFAIQKGLDIGFSFAEMPREVIEEILRNEWSGKHYSKRIWKNTDVLAEKLEEAMLSGIMSGKSYKKMARELYNLTDCGKYAAERIIRTETTYVTNMAELKGFEECGIKKYVFLATLDLRTSKVCRARDGTIVPVDKAISGVNLPPMHPNCRSTKFGYFGEKSLRNMQRRDRDPVTGRNQVIKNMNYNEWYSRYIKG